MSLRSTFYKYCPKNFKRPTKETDKCTICEVGKKLQKNEELDINEINYFKYYENNRKCVQNQKGNFKNQIQNLPDDECIIIIVFKQNFKIGGDIIETQKDFYTKTFLS